MNDYNDKFWHIQMHMPEGRDGAEIDPRDLLTLSQPVIGIGEWEDKQCEDFKNIPIGSIVLVRKGGQAIALCKITSDPYISEELEDKFIHINYRNVDVLGFISDEDQPSTHLFSQGTFKCCNNWTNQWFYINELLKHLK